MHFHFSFYSSLLLIFFTHGLLFSALLAKKAITQNERASFWLAGFTLVCTLNIVPWMLGHAGWYSLQPYRDILFYVPFQNFFLLGPLIFFYTQVLLNPGVRFSKRDGLHFLPAILYLVYAVVMFVTDKVVLQRYFFYADGHDRDLDTWYRLAGIASLSIYLVLSLRYYSLYKRLAEQVVSFADAVLLRWVKHYLLALLLMQVLDVAFFCLYPGWGSFTAKWWYYFAFSVLFYYVAFSAYTTKVQPPFSFRLASDGAAYLLQALPATLLADRTRPEEEPEQVIQTLADADVRDERDEPELALWKGRVLEALVHQEAYREPELTLQILARRLGTNASVLSKVVNRGFGVCFNDFVNGYRVDAVKQKLEAGEHRRQTLLGLALDCGFNSKTTFNRVFRKHTGVSPKEYIHRLTDGEEEAQKTVSQQYDVPNHDLGRPLSTVRPPSPENTRS